MKFTPRLSAIALLAITSATGALAEDPMDALKQATQAQNDAPACRMKIVATDPATKQVSTITLENVNPDKMHMKVESGTATQMEIVSDGSKAFMSQGGGKMVEAPAQMGAMIVQSRKQSSLDAMAKMAQDVKLAGHETLGGVPTSIYTFSSDTMGMHSATKLWVSDKDHRPLKADGETKGEQGGTSIARQLAITFDYDPNIKITLPAP